MTEKELVVEFSATKEALDSVKEKEKELNIKLESLKLKISELMEAQNKDRTASYEGVGFISAEKPKIRARYKKENETLVFTELEKIGRADLIKQSIHPSSLASFVGECLELNHSIPQGIDYYLQPQLKLYKR